MTEARLREGAVAKALFEKMTVAAVKRINEMSQDEMKQWGQVLKGSKATPETLCPSLKIENTAAEVLLLSNAPVCAVDPGDSATPARISTQLVVPRECNHEGERKQPINFPPGFEQVTRQCTDFPTVGEVHPSINQCEKTVPPSEEETENLASAVLPDALSNEKESASRTTSLDDMKFLARTQFGKRLVLLDALDASEVIPPETGDGLDEKGGVKTSAREDEKMPSASIRVQEGGETGKCPGTETGGTRSKTPTEETTSEVSRLKRAMKRGFGFLSVDQEMRLREASTEARDPEGIVYRADCQARKLCQGILTTDPMLILVAIEISIQNLMKEIRETSELEKVTAGKSNINPIDSGKISLSLPARRDLRATSSQSRSLPASTKNQSQQKNRNPTRQ